MSTSKNVLFKWVDEQTEQTLRLLIEDGSLVVETKVRGRWIGRCYRDNGPSARLLAAFAAGDEQLAKHGRVSAGRIAP